MSRGIRRREAIMMMLPMVNSQTLGYFESGRSVPSISGKAWPEPYRDATIPVDHSEDESECEKQEASSEQKPS